MAYTNRQLVRVEAGDAGTYIRDVTSGDAQTSVFYLSAPPLAADSQVVRITGALKTETADYTLNDETGELTFLAIPALATDNIIVTYLGVKITDAGIDEACRQVGLTPTATAEPADNAVIEAAAIVCDWCASAASGDFDFDADGQSIKRGSVARMWNDRAEALRTKLRRRAGLTSVETTRIDGYSRKGEVTGRAYEGTQVNPRRFYYGEQDVLP